MRVFAPATAPPPPLPLFGGAPDGDPLRSLPLETVGDGTADVAADTLPWAAERKSAGT